MTRLRAFLGLAVACCLLPVAAHACPLCVGSTPYEAGLYWSVLFLLPVPFVIAGSLAVWLKKNHREG